MSVTTPLPLVAFWEKIRFAHRPEFDLQQYRRQSMDAAGNILSMRRGSPKWRVDVVSSSGRHDDDMVAQALRKVLEGRDEAFLAYDIRRPFPKADPLGVVLGNATVTVRTVGSNNRSLSVQGLPSTYKLTTGDKLAVVSGAKRALLEIMEDVTASSGQTAEFEVQPFLPPWIAVGQTVELAKPAAKFKLVSGSYRPQGGSGNRSTGFSFTAVSVP